MGIPQLVYLGPDKRYRFILLRISRERRSKVVSSKPPFPLRTSDDVVIFGVRTDPEPDWSIIPINS